MNRAEVAAQLAIGLQTHFVFGMSEILDLGKFNGDSFSAWPLQQSVDLQELGHVHGPIYLSTVLSLFQKEILIVRFRRHLCPATF